MHLTLYISLGPYAPIQVVRIPSQVKEMQFRSKDFVSLSN